MLALVLIAAVFFLPSLVEVAIPDARAPNAELAAGNFHSNLDVARGVSIAATAPVDPLAGSAVIDSASEGYGALVSSSEVSISPQPTPASSLLTELPTVVVAPSPPVVYVLRTLRPGCIACRKWLGNPSEARFGACVHPTNGTCVAARGPHECDDGLITCDNAVDIALTSGSCKRYINAFDLVHKGGRFRGAEWGACDEGIVVSVTVIGRANASFTAVILAHHHCCHALYRSLPFTKQRTTPCMDMSRQSQPRLQNFTGVPNVSGPFCKST